MTRHGTWTESGSGGGGVGLLIGGLLAGAWLTGGAKPAASGASAAAPHAVATPHVVATPRPVTHPVAPKLTRPVVHAAEHVHHGHGLLWWAVVAVVIGVAVSVALILALAAFDWWLERRARVTAEVDSSGDMSPAVTSGNATAAGDMSSDGRAEVSTRPGTVQSGDSPPDSPPDVSNDGDAAVIDMSTRRKAAGSER